MKQASKLLGRTVFDDISSKFRPIFRDFFVVVKSWKITKQWCGF